MKSPKKCYQLANQLQILLMIWCKNMSVAFLCKFQLDKINELFVNDSYALDLYQNVKMHLFICTTNNLLLLTLSHLQKEVPDYLIFLKKYFSPTESSIKSNRSRKTSLRIYKSLLLSPPQILLPVLWEDCAYWLDPLDYRMRIWPWEAL